MAGMNRRDLFKFAAGAAAGVALSPVPWKLLDDVSIWTQNWSWIPPLGKGNVTYRNTVCSLCRAGCPVRARCLEGQPVSLSASAGPDGGRGALCVAGLLAHHLPYHPERLTRAVAIDGRNAAQPVAIGAAVKSFADAVRKSQGSSGNPSVAVLDLQPQRMQSLQYLRFLGAIGSDNYLCLDVQADASLVALSRCFEKPFTFGMDLEKARLILNLGAPLFEGWIQPSRAARLLDRRLDETGNPLTIIQVEPAKSRSALFADRWVPIEPGAETALVLALVHVVLSEGLYDPETARQAADLDKLREAAALFTPQAASRWTGIAQAEIFALARALATSQPSLVLCPSSTEAGPDRLSQATAALNLLLGGVKSGVLASRPSVPCPPSFEAEQARGARRLAEVDDASIKALIIDASRPSDTIPWALVRAKTTEDCVVAVMSPTLTGMEGPVAAIIPSPVFLESTQEIMTPPDWNGAYYGVSAAMSPAPPGILDPAAFLTKVAAELGLQGIEADPVALVKERVVAIHAAQMGVVFNPADGTENPVTGIASADDMHGQMIAGAVWKCASEGTDPGKHRFLPDGVELSNSTPEIPVESEQSHLVFAAKETAPAYSHRLTSPLIVKLTSESDAWQDVKSVRIHPSTARKAGVIANRNVRIEKADWKLEASLAVDQNVIPGVVAAPAYRVGKKEPRTSRQQGCRLSKAGENA